MASGENRDPPVLERTKRVLHSVSSSLSSKANPTELSHLDREFPIIPGEQLRNPYLATIRESFNPLVNPTPPSLPFEALRQHAANIFTFNQGFDDSAASLSLFKILQSHAGAVPDMSHTSLPKSRILDDLRLEITPASGHASLHLVRLERSGYRQLSVSPDLFLSLMKNLRIDENFLYLLGHEKGGFQHSRRYHGDNRTSCDTSTLGMAITAPHTDSYYLRTSLFTVLWSVTRTSGRPQGPSIATRVLLIHSNYQKIPDAQVFRDLVPSYLQSHAQLVCTPYLVHLAVSLTLASWVDTRMHALFYKMIEAETWSRHGVWGGEDTEEASLEELMEGSRQTGWVGTSLANMEKHAEYTLSVLGANGDDVAVSGDACDISVERPGMDADETVMMAMRVVRDGILMRGPDFESLREQVRTQSAVLLSLVQQKQTESALGISKSTLTLSESVRNDSAAMKLLALMAALFLPGTFFATLFSMPLLRWDEAKVVNGKFWIYWVFAVPATIALLVVYRVWLAGRRGKRSEKDGRKEV